MKKIIFLASIVQCIGTTQASLSSFSEAQQGILHRPINVSASQNKLTRYLPVNGTNYIAAIHDVSSNGDCLLYSLGITDTEHSTRSSESPGDTTNRASVSLFLLKNINSMSTETMHSLALALHEHFQDLDQYKAQLTLCYPNDEDFCLAMAFRLNRLNELGSLFENGENAELFQILGASRKNINTELIGNKPLRDRSLKLLHTALNSHSSSELLDFFAQKIKDTFNILSTFPERGFNSEVEKLNWTNFLKNGLYVLASTRIYLSASLCVFLAPMLKKNIQIWRESRSSSNEDSHLKPFRFFGRNQEEAKLSTLDALKYLADPNTYNISLRNGHYQVVTTVDTKASTEGSPEMIKAINCLNQMEFARFTGSSLTAEQIRSMSEKEQLAAAISNSLNLSATSDSFEPINVTPSEGASWNSRMKPIIQEIMNHPDFKQMQLNRGSNDVHVCDKHMNEWSEKLWNVFMSKKPQMVPTEEEFRKKIYEAATEEQKIKITQRYDWVQQNGYNEAQKRFDQIMGWLIDVKATMNYSDCAAYIIPTNESMSALYNDFLRYIITFFESTHYK